jgi:hypothetical protein
MSFISSGTGYDRRLLAERTLGHFVIVVWNAKEGESGA